MISSTPYLLGIAAAASTYAGGQLAMRFGRHRDLLLGVTCGMVVGLALLDLLPEAVEGGRNATDLVFGAVAIGMALYMAPPSKEGLGTLGPVQTVALVPYAIAKLRVTVFPVTSSG